MKKIDENYFGAAENQAPLKVEDLLKKDEKILWKGTPKRASFIMQNSSNLIPISILWGCIDIGIIVAILLTGSAAEMGPMAFVLIPFFAFHMMPVWICIGTIIKSSIKSKQIKYYITNKRIIEVSGKVAYIKSELKISDITMSNIKKSFWDKIFKVSDIYITANEGSMVLFDVPNGEYICNKLNGLITEQDSQEFFDQGLECEHCGSICAADARKCPNCGAGLVRK